MTKMRTFYFIGYLTLLGNLYNIKVSATTRTHRDIYFEDGGSGDVEPHKPSDPKQTYPPDEEDSGGSGWKSYHYDYDAEEEEEEYGEYDKNYSYNDDKKDMEGSGAHFAPPHTEYSPPYTSHHDVVGHEDDFKLTPELPNENVFEEILVDPNSNINSPPPGGSPDRMPSSTPPPTLTDTHTDMDSSIRILTQNDEERQVSIFAQPGILAAFIGGAVMGLLCAILLVMFIVYRMRKRDEGSYPLDEPKRVPLTSSYAPNDKEIYA